MNKEEKYSYWLEMAEYDLETADAMFKSGRYIYVAFMCQQSLEKLSKGLYNYYVKDQVPRVHNISFIIDKVLIILNEELEETTYQLFDKLSAYYLHGRYPAFKEKISSLIGENEAGVMLKKSKEVFKWLKSLKK